MKLKNLISEDMKNDKFIEMNKMNDVEFLKMAWNMEKPELKELLQFLEDKYERDKSLYKAVKGQVKALYKNGMNFYKSRIQFVYDIINDKNTGESIPDWAMAETIIRRRLAKLTESYAAIVSLPDTNVKEYAKAAIRDIFIQMPSRSVNLNNWNGYKNYISEFFGENSYETAMKELQNEGWLTKSDTRYEWRKMFGPVGTVPKKAHINEWADSIKTDKLDIDYKDEGAYPFTYDIKNYKVNFGKHMMTHATIYNIGDKKTDNILQGRVWTYEKILSLWEYPDTKSMYKAMINKINEEMQKLDIGKIDSSWKFEIANTAVDFMSSGMFDAMKLAKDSEGAESFRDIESFLIPVFDWTPDIMKNPKKYKKELEVQRNQHLMSPVAKTSDVFGGVGSKKTSGGLTQTQKHQMKSTSEQLREWADKIITPNKEYHYRDMDSYPFGYREGNDEIITGRRGAVHRAEGLDPERDEFLGRVWNTDKIISFWEYPESLSQLKTIVDDLNYHSEILGGKDGFKNELIDNSWKIDIPNLDFNINSLHILQSKGKIKKNIPRHEIYDIQSSLVPIFSYNPKMISNAKQFNKMRDRQLASHMLSPIAKKSDVQGSIGSKKTVAGLSPTRRHQMKSTSENKLNEIQTEYGCLMLKLNIPWWKDFVEVFIRDEDVYNNAAQEYGREYEPHITILYGFTEDVDVEQIKKILYTLKRPILATASKINIFKPKEFDVVKFDVESKQLEKLNEIMTANFDYITMHKIYSAHMTISYVKSGSGDKYVKVLQNPIHLSSSEFIYSYAGGRKETFNILKSS